MKRVRGIVMVALLATACAVGLAAQTASKPAPKPAAPAAAAKPATAGPVFVIETVKGTIEIETYPNEAPKTVAHLMALAKRNFYNGQRVHRVVKGFVVQFGDPQSRDMTKRDRWGTMGSGDPVGALESSPRRRHRVGAVALAHPGDPRQGDSQIYISMAAQPKLDGQFTVFGQVTSGMDVVQKLVVNDIIRRVTVKP
jgi:cyclophilin family peptidyl-prolyl cis-trans isomerase